MSLSLRLGFAAIPEDVAAALILLGDQPRMQADTITAVLSARGRSANRRRIRGRRAGTAGAHRTDALSPGR